MKSVKWVLVLSLWAPTLHALDVSYGKFFKITGITRAEGQLSMPVERKKYYNTRIGSKETYQFVLNCEEPCVQPVQAVTPTIQEVRPAQTRPDMWIVSVDLNRDWLFTFLVFRRGGVYSTKAPAELNFLDKTIKKQVEKSIISAVKQQAL